MILTNTEIKHFMNKGKIKIENFNPKNLGPVSYDLTIHDEVRYIDGSRKDDRVISASNPSVIGRLDKLPIILKKQDSLVFTTDEIISVDSSITGIVHARSSLTKLPILFNIPGLVDPGFRGSLTGVMYNLSGFDLKIEKMRICQIVFHSHNHVLDHYGIRKSSKNQGQRGKSSLVSRTDVEFQET